MICYRLAGREFLNRRTSRHCATLWQQISTNMVYMFPMPKLEPKLSFEENRELQQMLQKRGYDVGRIDGVLGLKSRTAVRLEQIKLGMPADGWPTPDLLVRLRGAR